MKLPILISSLLCWLTECGEQGSHEEQAIDNYCDAWKQFSDTGDWTDGWASIDFVDEDETIIDSISPSNIYDTYYSSECRRVRRPWNAMSSTDRSLYINGILELRSRGELKMELDEFVAVASVHDDYFGSVTHHDSDYLFWHGYLVWELESRIRNLGGKYRCFGMPYWDFTNEYSRNNDHQQAYIFETGLGGTGDPNDVWRVNGYSWDITIQQFWSPNHNDVCTAQNDDCPICSLKRDGDEAQFHNLQSADYYGAQVVSKSDFTDFQQWMVSEIGLPHSIDTSYDPIWYLFHSMESYLQGMWVNCNDYDLIDLDDLYQYPSAFSPYCDPTDESIGMTRDECVGIDLTDPMYFNGLLPKREWSYIHNEILTIKKLYSLPQWNVIYDLNGDSFFTESGLSQQCKNKINAEWFILPNDENENNKYYYKETKDQILTLNESISLHIYELITVVMIVFCVLSLSMLRKKHSKQLHSEYVGYGSV